MNEVQLRNLATRGLSKSQIAETLQTDLKEVDRCLLAFDLVEVQHEQENMSKKISELLRQGKNEQEIATELGQNIYYINNKTKFIKQTMKNWTKDEEQALVEMKKSKVSNVKIGEKLKRTPKAIHLKYKKLENPPAKAQQFKFYTPKEDAILISMREQNIPYSVISEKLKRTPDALGVRMSALKNRNIVSTKTTVIEKKEQTPKVITTYEQAKNINFEMFQELVKSGRPAIILL